MTNQKQYIQIAKESLGRMSVNHTDDELARIGQDIADNDGPAYDPPGLDDACMQAYSDCNDTIGERDLNFRAPKPFTALELRLEMPRIVPDGYNAFSPTSTVERVIECFGETAEYTVAREGSVCLYVKTDRRIWLSRDEELMRLADEVSVEPDGTFRLWWD